MRKLLGWGALAAVLAAGVLPTPATAHPANVLMQTGAVARGFEPPSWPMAAGAAVSFGNFDGTGLLHHPVAGLPGDYGPPCFDAGVLGPNDIVWVTPPCTGIVAYHCVVHPWMVATLRISG